jgi:glycopeptide antibiotics resistance protein
MNRLRLIFSAYLLFLILIAVLPLNNASSGTMNGTYVVRIRLDYLLHSLLFVPWTFLYSVTFRPGKAFDKWIMIGAGLIMAFTTEGVQYFLAYRAYNLNDMLSNFLGVLLGSFVLFMNLPHEADDLLKKQPGKK